MPISVLCPLCAARIRLPDHAAGRRFRCPKCKGVIAGPGPEPPPAPVTEPLSDEPIPISQAARKALEDPFNPFDDGTETEEEERPRRYWKPKDDYNPFAEPATSGPTSGGADPGELFDFGTAEQAPPPPDGGLDFGPTDPPDGDSPRRRR